MERRAFQQRNRRVSLSEEQKQTEREIAGKEVSAAKEREVYEPGNTELVAILHAESSNFQDSITAIDLSFGTLCDY